MKRFLVFAFAAVILTSTSSHAQGLNATQWLKSVGLLKKTNATAYRTYKGYQEGGPFSVNLEIMPAERGTFDVGIDGKTINMYVKEISKDKIFLKRDGVGWYAYEEYDTFTVTIDRSSLIPELVIYSSDGSSEVLNIRIPLAN